MRMPHKIVIDINGRDGTLYTLLGHVRTLGEERGFDSIRINEVRDEIVRCAYESAVVVFQREFGDMVQLVQNGKPFIMDGYFNYED